MMTFVSNAIRGLQSGLRLFHANPGVAISAVVALALGIGFSATMFSIVHGATRSLPFEDADAIVAIQMVPDSRPADYVAWARTSAFDALGAFQTMSVNVGGLGGAPERVSGARLTATTFGVVRTAAWLGRPLLDVDARAGAEPVVVLSHELWMRRYAGDGAVVGQPIRLDGVTHTVVGVMPPRFGFPIRAAFWTPLAVEGRDWRAGEGDTVQVFGRLRAGVTADMARTELMTVTERLAQEAPERYRHRRVAVIGFTEIETPREVIRALYLLLLGVTGVLFIACANVANLFIARAAARGRDVAVRLALGANRRAILIEQIAESLVLSALAGAAGLAIAAAGTRVFRENTAHIIEAFWVDFRLDGTVVGYAIGLAMLSAAGAATVPALRAAGTDVADALRDGVLGSSGLRIGRASRWLVSGQIAFACGLLALTLLLGRSAVALHTLAWPFDGDLLLSSNIGIPRETLDDANRRVLLLTALDEELRRAPGAVGSALASALPGRGSGNWSFTLDSPAEDSRVSQTTNLTMVSPGYFGVLGATAVQGRLVESRDAPNAPAVAVVNRSFVQRFSPDRDPIGRHIFVGRRELTIVGVVADLIPGDIQDGRQDGIYASIFQLRPFAVRLIARGSADPLSLTPVVRAAIERVDPDLSMYETFTVRDAAFRDKQVLVVLSRLFGVFGLGAMLLTAIGLYSVTAFAVAARTREFGIRIALGATRRDLVRLVALQGGRQVSIGLALGTLFAFGLARAFSAAVEGIAAPEGSIIAGVVTCLGLTAMVALAVPSRRAAAVNPIQALRHGQ
jgi:predicted permease